MPITVTPLTPHFAAEVTGVDIARGVDAATYEAVRAAFEEHSVLVFPAQDVDDDQQAAFSALFGPLEKTIKTNVAAGSPIAVISNVGADGRIVPPDDKRLKHSAGNALWHTDSSFKKTPALASMLSGREVPPVGGETQFASTRVAWARLPAETRARLEGLVGVHSLAYSRGLIDPKLMNQTERAEVPPVLQVLVRENPVNGRKNYYVASHLERIVGMPVAEGRALAKELIEFATQPEYVYTHKWRPKDLVMWDNRCTMHRGRPWDTANHRRVMHRTTISDAAPTVPADMEVPREALVAAE